MAVGVNPWSASATSTASKTLTCDGVGRCWVTSHNASSENPTLPIRSVARFWPSSAMVSASEVPSEVGKWGGAAGSELAPRGAAGSGRAPGGGGGGGAGRGGGGGGGGGRGGGRGGGGGLRASRGRGGGVRASRARGGGAARRGTRRAARHGRPGGAVRAR